jgi:hypothetical protein
MKEARKRTPVINTSESLPKTSCATEDAENVALLAKCTQNNWGRRCLFSAGPARENPSSVRQTVFSWQSEITYHIF